MDLRSVCPGLLLPYDLCGVFCLPFSCWHLLLLVALSNPHMPWAIWAGRLWAPRKGDWLRLWLELSVAGVSEVTLRPGCVLYCMACLTVFIGSCLLPAWWLCWRWYCWPLWLYFCFHVWHQHSGADEVCGHPCFSLFLLRPTFDFYQCLIWKQMGPFRIQKLHEGWRKTFTRLNH